VSVYENGLKLILGPPVTIRLAPVIPTTVAVVQFPNVRQATEAVAEVMNLGVGIRTSTLLYSCSM
jgi:D-lactate dehydrogenase (cytochrome)